MNIQYMHPKEQLVTIMERIYGYGMTTTSGGNLSIKDENGDIWITPGGVDKGSLKFEDIVCVKANGEIIGNHKPSIELPFHLAIYKKRDDVKAILHAHPPALVAFSIARKVPDTSILPNARLICGEVGFAPYALPGSERLGENIAATFAEGFNTVLLENHGTATVGKTIFQAFERFETLDFCSRLIIKARSIGNPVSLSNNNLSLIKSKTHLIEEFEPEIHTSKELELRKQLSNLIHRGYEQRLFTSTEGTLSVRVDKSSFLITPYGMDRKYIGPEDLVLIKDKKRERGRIPSRSLLLHEKIYRKHPEKNAVVISHPHNVMAFGVSHKNFDTLTIPESYVMLRDIPVLPYGEQYKSQDKVADMLSPENPVVLVENDCIITVGKSLLEAFDRLEVAEFSAKSILYTSNIGEPVYINEKQKQELMTAFIL